MLSETFAIPLAARKSAEQSASDSSSDYLKMALPLVTPNSREPAPRFASGHATHVGLKRIHNEDSFCCDVKLGLFLVADGMGGHEQGALASEMARICIVNETIDGRDLNHAINIANREIGARGHLQKSPRTMGTTVVALRIAGTDFELAWVGDSRCYLAFGNELVQLSTDHSVVGEMIVAGTLTPESAKTSRFRNFITQALGVTASELLQIGASRGTVKPGMQFLLCSDGLTEHVPNSEIAKILQGALDPQTAVEQLIKAALADGGSDNVTAVMVKIL